MRADLYRIFRSKALYISLGVLIAYTLLSVGSMVAMNSIMDSAGLQMEMFITEADNDAFAAMTGMSMSDLFREVNGINITGVLQMDMSPPIFITLPILLSVAAAMFSSGAVKNGIAVGMCRTRLYLSKLLLSSAFAVAVLIIYMLVGILFATALRGFGGPAPSGYWGDLFAVFGAQALALLAFNCIGIFLTFITKRSGAVIGAFIGFYFVPQLLILIFMNIFDNLPNLIDYDLPTVINRFAQLPSLDSRLKTIGFCVVIFYIAATTLGGIFLFKRAEIK
jgi:hypothetical protein